MNILLDLHYNSSHPTQPRSIIAKYSVFFQSKHLNLQSFENHDPLPSHQPLHNLDTCFTLVHLQYLS